MMAKHLFYFTTILLLSGATITTYADVLSPRETTIQFYEASRAGDIEQMKRLVGGSYQNAREALFANNNGYSDFLRDYYRGATFRVGKAEVDQDSGVASIEIVFNFEDNRRDRVTLVLHRDQIGFWRIVASDPS